MKIDVEHLDKYLPSKKFSKILLYVGLSVIIIIFIGSKFSNNYTFTSGAKKEVLAKTSVGELLTKDSNSNGIADWEESLWGFDPIINGEENRKAILLKKSSAGIDISDTEDASGTPTDQFAKELTATVLALNDAGALTPEAVANLADSISKKTNLTKIPENHFTESDLHVSNVSKSVLQQNLKKIADKYSKVGLGKELEILSSAFSSEDEGVSLDLDSYAKAYLSMANDLIATPVPSEVSKYMLNLANMSYVMGQALLQAEKMHEDVFSGMTGVDSYVKASDKFDDNIFIFRAYFST